MSFSTQLSKLTVCLVMGLSVGLSAVLLCGFSVVPRLSRVDRGPAVLPPAGPPGGLVFDCNVTQYPDLKAQFDDYLREQGIPWQFLVKVSGPANEFKGAYLAPAYAAPPLELHQQIALGIRDTVVELPSPKGPPRAVITVSQQEILYALMHPARATTFSGAACDIQALKDHVGIRQNTVAWAQSLEWSWPEGGYAKWNRKYWHKGDPVPGHPLHEAVNDAFVHQERYSVGCYTATKLVMLQGVLDYYQRIRPDPAIAAMLQQRLTRDNDPLSLLEPGALWSFEPDSTPQDRQRPGKLLGLQNEVASTSFIPGDWAYFLNTDPVTYEKTGYEGSNAIYLGRGLFDDYYNDHNHSYTYAEKLNEVYQWRHRVFSASRDAAKVQPLSAQELSALTQTPDNGGLQLSLRAVPLLYGFQELPLLSP